MKIVSWNINALKAHEDAFRYAIELLQPDVFCLQEIRTREDLYTVRVKGYRSYMNPAKLSQCKMQGRNCLPIQVRGYTIRGTRDVRG